MNTNNGSSNLYTIVAFVVGLLIGLVLLGWYVFPVEWEDASFNDLIAQDKDNLIYLTSDYLATTGQSGLVQSRLLPGWANNSAFVADVCELQGRTADPTEVAKLDQLAVSIVNQNCQQFGAAGGAAGNAVDDAGRGFGTFLLLALLFALLLGIIYVLMRRRSELVNEAESLTIGGAMPEDPPTLVGDDDVETTPLARFQSSYTIGRDNYDDSFSIENSSGDFLGECGVGISESIGSDSPKNVTAFEVWLFDKNDIRTVTKVVMSEHAFYDDALKAKLAPKGEPVRAMENEVIVLETASLIINATIKTMNYGVGGTLPPESFFENFTVELSAWAKDGDIPEADIEGRINDLDF